MWSWVNRNAEGLQALGGFAAALFALAALIVIPWQIGQADRIQREQGARDIYREFLNISIANPKLATADWCALKEPAEIAAYEAYVEYLFYATEQLVGIDDEWRGPMVAWMADHAAYVCNRTDWDGYTPAVQALVAEFATGKCKAAQACQ